MLGSLMKVHSGSEFWVTVVIVHVTSYVPILAAFAYSDAVIGLKVKEEWRIRLELVELHLHYEMFEQLLLQRTLDIWLRAISSKDSLY